MSMHALSPYQRRCDLLHAHDIASQYELGAPLRVVLHRLGHAYSCLYDRCWQIVSYRYELELWAYDIPFVIIHMVGFCIYWNYGRLYVVDDKSVINSSASLQSVRRAMDISKEKVIDNLKSLRRQDVGTQPGLKTNDRFPLLPTGPRSHQSSYPAPSSNYSQYLKVKLQADTKSLIR